jgi:uncharacterized protein
MLEAREQLERLLRIQELALEIRSGRAIVEGAPGRVEEIEGRFRERNAEYVAFKDRYELLEKDRRDRTLELETLEASRKKFMESLMQVKNQREYSAVLKEIDAVKAQIASHEEAILKGMEENEKLKVELDARSEHIEKERALVGEERVRVEAEAGAAAGRIEEAERERAALETELPRDLIENMRRVEENRQGVFMARAEKELCQVCFVRIRPQVYQEIRQAARVHVCGHCRRYLYYEPSLKSQPGAPPAEPPSSGLEALNGGPA